MNRPITKNCSVVHICVTCVLSCAYLNDLLVPSEYFVHTYVQGFIWNYEAQIQSVMKSSTK